MSNRLFTYLKPLVGKMDVGVENCPAKKGAIVRKLPKCTYTSYMIYQYYMGIESAIIPRENVIRIYLLEGDFFGKGHCY
jgi:hypothetical protein